MKKFKVNFVCALEFQSRFIIHTFQANICLNPGLTGIACNEQIEAVSIEIPETAGIKAEPCNNTGLAEKDPCEVSEMVSELEDIRKQIKVELRVHDGSKDIPVVDKNLHMGTIRANKITGFFKHGAVRNDNSRENARVPVMKLNCEAFRGANVKHVHGYAGLRITPDEVHLKLSRLRTTT